MFKVCVVQSILEMVDSDSHTASMYLAPQNHVFRNAYDAKLCVICILSHLKQMHMLWLSCQLLDNSIPKVATCTYKKSILIPRVPRLKYYGMLCPHVPMTTAYMSLKKTTGVWLIDSSSIFCEFIYPQLPV